MIPIAALTAISAIPAVTQAITGLTQSARSKDILRNLERPTYNIPLAATEALNRSKNLASSNQMAGQSNVTQRIDQATANSLYDINQNSSSGVEALAALSGVYSNQMDAENQLGLNAAQDYQRRQAAVNNELNRYAGYQDAQWDYNVNQPFQEKAAAAQALGEAGMRNKYEGLKGVVGAASMGLSGMGNKSATNQSSLPADALTQNFSPNTPKSLEQFGKSLEGATSLSKVLNPNITGYNQYGQPQFDNGLGKSIGVLENKAMNTPQLTPNVVEEVNVPKIAQKEASLLPQKPLTAEMIAKAPALLSMVGKKDSPFISPIEAKSNVDGLSGSPKPTLAKSNASLPSNTIGDAAFKFGGNATDVKTATDTNIPWRNFMEGKWTYEGVDCDLKGTCPSDDDVNGARRALGSMVTLQDFGYVDKQSRENGEAMNAETFIELVNTEGTKQNKLWKTANLPFPATTKMLNSSNK